MSSNSLPLPNTKPSTLNIDLDQFVQLRSFELASPYDVFVEGQRSLIVIANRDTTDVLNMQLLTLGLSSLIEHYFRSILSRAVLLCAESMKKALRDCQISLAAANYYRGNDLGRAIFDSVNFSGSEIVVELTNKYLSINLGKTAPDDIKVALSDLQKIFILRHAVVHAHGFLSPKNLMELKLEHDKPSAVSGTYAAFESMMEIALNSIQSYNNFAYTCLLRRAYQNGQISFDGSTKDIDVFVKYWSLFGGRDSDVKNLTVQEIYNLARAYFQSV